VRNYKWWWCVDGTEPDSVYTQRKLKQHISQIELTRSTVTPRRLQDSSHTALVLRFICSVGRCLGTKGLSTEGWMYKRSEDQGPTRQDKTRQDKAEDGEHKAERRRQNAADSVDALTAPTIIAAPGHDIIIHQYKCKCSATNLQSSETPK